MSFVSGEKIRIKRIDETLPLPEYKTVGAAAFDFYSRENVEISSGGVGYVPLNCVIEITENHFLLLAARSSVHKKGLMLANGIGIIDRDFCGPEDEIRAAYYNFSRAAVKIERGERIAQGMILAVDKIDWNEAEIDKKTRGGFGSTGN